MNLRPCATRISNIVHCKTFPFRSPCAGEIGKFGRGLSAFAGEGGGRSFVQLAALAGCDYIDNVRGLGLLSALPIITKFRVIPADKRVSRILMHLQKMGKTVSKFSEADVFFLSTKRTKWWSQSTRLFAVGSGLDWETVAIVLVLTKAF